VTSDAAMTGGKSAEVRAQYEALPYPPRDPADEAKRLVTGSPSHVLEIDHYVFAGRRDWTAPFRALVAGCGTGDGAIMLGQQLADLGCPAEIECLDLSDAALMIAKARAESRGLRSLRFHRVSLLELDRLGLASFDYIDCCGVLHHLDDPSAGLGALRRVLKPGGGMGIMVYAPLGRAGVYETQALLRLAGRDLKLEERLPLARRLIAALPPTHPFKRNTMLGDHERLGDAGLADLLLHPCDRAYTVSELAALVEGAGLAISALIEPARYRPELLVTEPDLVERLRALEPPDSWAAAELLGATLKRHIAYLVEPERRTSAAARPRSRDAVPVLKDVSVTELRRTIGTAGALVLNFDGAKVRLALPPNAARLIALIDGRRNLGEIEDRAVADRLVPDRAAFHAAFATLYDALNGANILLLRYFRSRK